MNAVVLLDTGPLGVLTNPNRNPQLAAIRQWLVDLQAAGRRVILPEISDYELRRELLRKGSGNAIFNLDQLQHQIEYLAITTPVMRLAAELWAQARNTGRQTAHDHALDGDVILAAQAQSLGVAVVVATDNPAHLSRFVPSESWSTSLPDPLPEFAVRPLLVAFAVAFASHATAADKPNVVFVLADDMGYGDVRCLNPNGKIATPNLDRLAAAGMTFTDAYSPSAVCSPTRYGVMTGRYAWRSKLKNGVLGGLSPRLIEPGRLTVAQLLKNNGYHTACVGKWHLGMDWVLKPGKTVSPLSIEPRDQVFNVEYDKPITNGPNAVGFDYYFGISASLDMVPYAFIENDRVRGTLTEDRNFEMYPGKPATTRKGPAAPGFLDTDVLPALTRKAVSYIGERAKAGGPFFLYLPFASPHTPVSPNKEWAGKSGLTPYADFVMQTDAAVGEVLAALDTHNLANDTLVIFTSDNGFSPAADLPAHLKLGHNPNFTFRGHKADIYEGGHRVPFLVRWPAQVKPGTKSDALACLIDLTATCADIVGKKLPPGAGEDSVSLLPALGAGKGAVRDTLVVHSINGSFAVRDGKWKLCLCPGSGGWSSPRPGKDDATNLPPVQLFDLSADIGETTNLHAKHPDVVDRLTKLVEKYAVAGRSTPGDVQTNATPVDVWKAGRDAAVPLKKK